MARLRAAIALLLILSGLALPIQAGTITDDGSGNRTFTENFESFNAGQAPTDSWYTVTTTGTVTQQVASPAVTGSSHSWKITDGAVGAGAQISNTGTGVNACTAGQTFNFKVALDASPSVSSDLEFRLTTGAVSAATEPANTIGFAIAGTAGAETINSWVRGSSGAATQNSHAAAYTAPGILNVQISQVNCGGAAVSAVFTYSGAFSLAETVTGTSTLTGTLSRLEVASAGTFTSGTSAEMDDLTWSGAQSPPTIMSLSPASGAPAGGTSFTITGTGFRTGATVSIGGTAATGVTVNSGTSITATSPAKTAGTYNVVVTNTDGQAGTKVNGFTYLTPPTFTSISPTSGTDQGGTSFTITGTGFQIGATVTFDFLAATSLVVSAPTGITGKTPANADGPANIIITNPDGGSVTANSAFAFFAPSNTPTITTISPNTGGTNGGTAVTITGTNFVSGAVVKFGGTLASSTTFVSSTTMQVTTPSHASGAVDVTVQNPDTQTATSTGGFTYAATTVASVSPTSGSTAGGTAVTITGTNFRSGATATFGGASASNVAVTSPSTITATTPPGAAGAVTVVVTNSDGASGSLASGYTYATPAANAPTVTGVQPTNGPVAGGTTVTITGTNFRAGASVTFGGQLAIGVNVASPTAISATTPQGTAAGAVTVVVTNSDGTSGSLASAYTYNALPAPGVTKITPTSCDLAGGCAFNITGHDFRAGVTVTFGTNNPVVNPKVVDSGHITGTVPATTGSGNINVVVTETDGQTASVAFTYTGGTGSGTFVASGVSNSGRFSAIAVSGTTIAVAHVAGSANAVVLSISTDGGGTWADHPTGQSGVFATPDGSAHNLQVFIGATAGTYDIVYVAPTPSIVSLRTPDSGATWTAVTIATPAICSANSHLLRGIGGGAISTRIFVSFESRIGDAACGGTCNGVLSTAFSDNVGTTWTTKTVITGELTSCTGGNPSIRCYGASTLYPTSTTAWTVAFERVNSDYNGHCSPSSSGFAGIFVRNTADSGNTWTATNLGTACGCLDDSINPVGSLNLVPVFTPTGDYVTAKSGSNAYVGARQASGQYFFTNLGATNSFAVEPASAGTAAGAGYGVASSPTLFAFQQTNDGGAHYTSQQGLPSGPNTADPVVGSIGDGVCVFYFTFQNPSTQLLNVFRKGATVACGGGATALGVTHTLGQGASGFDVDPTGASFILRTLGSNIVKAGAGSTLTLGTASVTTNCQSLYGVSSLLNVKLGQTFLAFYDCSNSGSHRPIDVRYTDSQLASVAFPSTCGDFCLTVSIDCGGDAGGGQQICYRDDHSGGLDQCTSACDVLNVQNDLSDVQDFPYDYSKHSEAGNDKTYLGLAASTSTGKIRALVQNFINNDADGLALDEQTIDPAGGAIDQLCTAHTGPEEADYDVVYGMAKAAQVKGFKVDYNLISSGLGGHDIFVPNIQNVAYQNTALSSGANALGCGGSHLLYSRANGQVVYADVKKATSSIINTTKSTVLDRGVALDPLGNYGAYIKDQCIVLFTFQHPDPIQCVPLPAGFFPVIVKMELSNFGQQLYVATTQEVYEWDTAKAYNTTNVNFVANQDTDSDGVVDQADPDIDGDGVCNTGGPLPVGTPGAANGCVPGTCTGTDGQVHDCDINGDGICNPGVLTQPASTTSGAPNGCQGDTRPPSQQDSDGDGIPDSIDPQPFGPITGANDATCQATNTCANLSNPNTSTTSSAVAAASFGIPLEDGTCIFCLIVASIGLTAAILPGWVMYVLGFLMAAGSIILAGMVSRKNNTHFSSPANGQIVGLGMGGGFLFFAFPGWIILMCFTFAAVGLFLGKKFGGGNG